MANSAAVTRRPAHPGRIARLAESPFRTTSPSSVRVLDPIGTLSAMSPHPTRESQCDFPRSADARGWSGVILDFIVLCSGRLEVGAVACADRTATRAHPGQRVGAHRDRAGTEPPLRRAAIDVATVSATPARLLQHRRAANFHSGIPQCVTEVIELRTADAQEALGRSARDRLSLQRLLPFFSRFHRGAFSLRLVAVG